MAWRLLPFQNYNIFENMAIDEAIFLETCRDKKPPTIRFYGSSPYAISIGYFQDAEKDLNIEKCRRQGIDIARRITGGKAVYHFNELTYSIAACEQEKKFPSDVAGTYEIISQCIARGLRCLGIKAILASDRQNQAKEEMNSCCFSTPAKSELLVNGRKICGSAQVRKREGFLQHGLLLLDTNPEKMADFLFPASTPERVEKLKKTVAAVNEETVHPVNKQEICSELKRGFIEELGISLEEGCLTSGEEKLKNELLKKYTDADWNIDRKKYFKAVS
jgi:lipoate-protein ligase A